MESQPSCSHKGGILSDAEMMKKVFEEDSTFEKVPYTPEWMERSVRYTTY